MLFLCIIKPQLVKPVEIELKAFVNCPKDCKKKLKKIAGTETAISKNDTYWFTGASAEQAPKFPVSGLRVRYEKRGNKKHTLVTWKNKKKQGRIEINDEHEFEISDGAEFEALLKLLGHEQQIIKHKQGWVWHYDGITAELCEVSGFAKQDHFSQKSQMPSAKNLGWFLELEILSGDDSAETVTAAGKKLLLFLEKTGVGKEHIESRYYAEMLTIL